MAVLSMILILEKGINSLNETGRLIAVLPQRIIIGEGTAKQRKFLIDHDLIESVISLPNGLFSNTSISFVIVVINRNKQNQGEVRFVKADNFIEAFSPHEIALKVDQLIDVLNNSNQNDALIIVKNEVIAAQAYKLSFVRYSQPANELDTVERKAKLNELLIELDGQQVNSENCEKVVGLSDLKDDIINFEFYADGIQKSELSNQKVYLVDDSCLLLAMKSGTIIPSYFIYEGEPVYRTQDILSFKVNKKKVDIAYLINELHAEYVQKQLANFKDGSTIPNLQLEDVLSLEVKLPSLVEQRAKVKGIKEALLSIKNRFALDVEDKFELLKQYNRQLSSLKHALGTPLLKLNSGMRNLKRSIIENEKTQSVLRLSSQLNVNLNFTVEDQLASLEKALSDISKLLEMDDHELDLAKYELEPIDICFFFIKYIEELDMNYSNKFDCMIESSHNDIDPYAFDKVFVRANMDLLRRLFDNIVSNAMKHGFTSQTKLHRIVFYIGSVARDQTRHIEIVIENNGNPFPLNYDKEKFIQKHLKAGPTGNKGRGGYEINKIVQHFDGDFDLELDPNSTYPVSFSLYLPVFEIKS